jgi:hypothetical protein
VFEPDERVRPRSSRLGCKSCSCLRRVFAIESPAHFKLGNFSGLKINAVLHERRRTLDLRIFAKLDPENVTIDFRVAFLSELLERPAIQLKWRRYTQSNSPPSFDAVMSDYARAEPSCNGFRAVKSVGVANSIRVVIPKPRRPEEIFERQRAFRHVPKSRSRVH